MRGSKERVVLSIQGRNATPLRQKKVKRPGGLNPQGCTILPPCMLHERDIGLRRTWKTFQVDIAWCRANFSRPIVYNPYRVGVGSVLFRLEFLIRQTSLPALMLRLVCRRLLCNRSSVGLGDKSRCLLIKHAHRMYADNRHSPFSQSLGRPLSRLETSTPPQPFGTRLRGLVLFLSLNNKTSRTARLLREESKPPLSHHLLPAPPAVRSRWSPNR